MPPQGRFSADRLPPLPFPLLPVATGRHSHDFGEQSGEIVRIVYADLEADLVNLHISCIQQVTGLLDFQQIEIRQRSVPGHLLEQHGVVGCQARQDFLCRTLPEKAPSGRQSPQLFLQATELRKEPPVRHRPVGLFRRLAARLADLGGRPAGTQYPPLPKHDGTGTFGPGGETAKAEELIAEVAKMDRNHLGILSVMNGCYNQQNNEGNGGTSEAALTARNNHIPLGK